MIEHERRAHRDGERAGRDHVGGSQRSTVTNCIRSVSAIGRTTSSSVSPPPASRTVRTLPDRDRVGERAELRAARGERGAGLGRVVDLRLEARVDEEVLTLALPVRGAGGQVAAEEPDADEEVGVGDELHRRSVRGDLHDPPDEPGTVHHRHVDLEAVVAPLADVDGVREVRRVARQHACGGGVDGARPTRGSAARGSRRAGSRRPPRGPRSPCASSSCSRRSSFSALMSP